VQLEGLLQATIHCPDVAAASASKEYHTVTYRQDPRFADTDAIADAPGRSPVIPRPLPSLRDREQATSGSSISHMMPGTYPPRKWSPQAFWDPFYVQIHTGRGFYPPVGSL